MDFSADSSYGEPLASNVYSAPSSPTVIYKEVHKPKKGKRGDSITPALLAILPLSLLGGLALGLLLPFNITGFTGLTLGNTGSTIVNNITIGGITVNNTFNPTNFADQTNSKTNNAGRRKRDFEYDDESLPLIAYIRQVWETLLVILATTNEDFQKDMVFATSGATPGEIINQFFSLNKKLNCLQRHTVTSKCEDFAICMHFAEDFNVFDKNLLIRGSEIFLIALVRYFRNGTSIEEVEELMENAEEGSCQNIGHCNQEDQILHKECLLHP